MREIYHIQFAVDNSCYDVSHGLSDLDDKCYDCKKKLASVYINTRLKQVPYDKRSDHAYNLRFCKECYQAVEETIGCDLLSDK